jgi:TonB dependent receptor
MNNPQNRCRVSRLPRYPFRRKPLARYSCGLLPAAVLLCAGSPLAARAEAEVKSSGLTFVAVDRVTHRAVPGAQIDIEDLRGEHFSCTLRAGYLGSTTTVPFEPLSWSVCSSAATSTTVYVPLDGAVTVKADVPAAQGPPVKDIYIKVTAHRIVKKLETSGGTTLSGADLKNRLGSSAGSSSTPIKASTTTGAAEDSSGQVHVRGEHSEIAYVIDGVALPDSLSGRQGSIIVPSTIQSLDILTGGYAPEFGGQTAAVLNVSTLPDVAHAKSEYEFAGGSNSTFTSNYTAVGPIFTRASYVINVAANHTNMAQEPQQPTNQTAHNEGASIDMFARLHFNPDASNSYSLTLSRSPVTQQVNNRTGLPAAFASGGQGYGFLGLRNADGSRPDAVGSSAPGAATMILGSQQDDGMDITTREVNEFASLLFKHQFDKKSTGTLSLTLMHSGQDVHNNNPSVNLLNLPVDNSIEYNPTATRNIHHVQSAGSYSTTRGTHNYKAGILLDDQNGTETYQIVPASQLALNALAALAPNLVPNGSVMVDSGGNVVTDVDGNPVYVPTSGVSPVVTIHRAGFYRAAYAQDSWDITKKLHLNYGLRFDWYRQTQSLGETVDTAVLQPRINFSYALNRLTVFRLSYNRLFNTPPIAQGASIGASIQPETLDQYDVSADRDISKGQHIKVAYYVKQMRNQVDTGLLLPGSMIGLYSAVNFQIGAVHGLEFAYTLSPLIVDPKTKKKYGWDAYLNYSYSIAAPNGLDNTGAPVPDYNDHDQRNTLSLGGTYNWRSGATAGVMINHASGLASSPIPPSTNRQIHTTMDLQASTGPRLFHGKGGIGLEVDNLFDVRGVINFQSGFSGTRFLEGRRFMLNVFGSF